LTVVEQHMCSKFSKCFFGFDTNHALRQSRHWSVNWSATLCCMPNHTSIRIRFSLSAFSF